MVLLQVMKVRFYIEKRRDKEGNLQMKDQPVFMSVSFNGNRVMLGTEIKVDIHFWDPELQRVKNSFPGSAAYNIWLDTLRDTAERAMIAIHNSWEVDQHEHFKTMFQELKPKFSLGFFDVFYLFLEEGINRWSSSTYQKVRTIHKHLREFEDETGFGISFSNMDDNFLEQFSAFYKNKGNSRSTTVKAVNIIVWFLNWASEKEYNLYRKYRGFYKTMGKIQYVPGKQLYLLWDELVEISQVNTDNRRKERVRDLFCFMCFSGLRFSDLRRLKKDDFAKDEIIIRDPGSKGRKLPLNNHSREIYKKYENKFYLDNTAFPSMSLVTMNKYLKQIGREAGLTRLVTTLSGEGSSVPLFERLTAGIAVNTFIANALELDIPADILSSFTGVRNDHRVRRIKMDLARKEIKKFDGQ